MIRRIFSFVIIAAVISSCGNAVKKDAASKADGSEKAVKVEFASLIDNPDNYINKNIIIDGKVVHVCTMSGKKLFIVGENPDVMLFIAAGENMPKFPMELLGSEIVVEGTITRLGLPAMGTGDDHQGMKTGKGMIAMESGAKTIPGDSCVTETALAAQSALANMVMEYKKHTVK